MLAGHLGRTVEELGSMSALEFRMWQAFYSVQPWGLPDLFLQALGRGKGDKMIRDPKQMAAALNLMARRSRG